MASVMGYSRPQSVAPGETLAFCVSADVDYKLAYLRLLEFAEGGARTPLLPVSQEIGAKQPVPRFAYWNGCGWQASFTLSVPEWESGLYAAELTPSDGDEPWYVVFIVRPTPGEERDFAVLANTNTWNAYNEWTSDERPNPLTFPYEGEPYPVPHLTRAELWLHQWMSEADYHFDVYSDYDLHCGLLPLECYKGFIINTHPEYWSARAYDALKDYVDHGGRVLYLGGNGLFEEISYSEAGDALVYFEGKIGIPWRDSYYFRNRGRPERGLLGVAFLYNNYGSAPAPYRVRAAKHRFFAGTGVRRGKLIGKKGFPGAASGREMDSSLNANRDPDDPKIVSAWVGDDRGNHPDNLVVLAVGQNVPEPGGVTHSAHLTCYDTPAGGFVLSAGSIMFTGSLSYDPALDKLVKNALDECLAKG